MNKKIVSAGNSGPKVRSDCEVIIEGYSRGGISLDITSKVKALYGRSIKSLCMEMMEHFGIRNAKVFIIDSGALPFVIAARIEAAICKFKDTEAEFLPPMEEENLYPAVRDRFRFSRLYLPGNTPSLMINAGLHQANGIILDLEDSVAPDKKDEARILVRNALRQIDFRGAERMVRINQGETGIRDLRAVVPHNTHMILIPKCESPAQIKETDNEINKLRKQHGIRNHLMLMPIIETALGIENCYEIAQASVNVVALAIGLEDLTSDMGVQRTPEGKETLFARSRLIMASKAAGKQPIDSVFPDVADMEGLKQTVINSRSLGFEGMGCIHPRQIAVINEGFAPDIQEIDKAKKIVIAYDEARKNGLGVVASGTRMIDAPVVARAQKTISIALKLGKLPENWKSGMTEQGN